MAWQTSRVKVENVCDQEERNMPFAIKTECEPCKTETPFECTEDIKPPLCPSLIASEAGFNLATVPCFVKLEDIGPKLRKVKHELLTPVDPPDIASECEIGACTATASTSDYPFCPPQPTTQLSGEHPFCPTVSSIGTSGGRTAPSTRSSGQCRGIKQVNSFHMNRQVSTINSGNGSEAIPVSGHLNTGCSGMKLVNSNQNNRHHNTVSSENGLEAVPVLLYKNVHTSESSSESSHSHKNKRALYTADKRLRTQGRRKKIKCSECTATFWSLGSLRVHESVKHLRKKADRLQYKEEMKKKALETVEKFIAGSELRKLKCTECGRQCHSAARLEVHMSTHFSDKPYECPQCWLTFKTRAEKKAHFQSHGKDDSALDKKPYECMLCSSAYRTEKSLASHVKTHTLTSQRHKCEECGQVFRTKNRLISHASVHVQESIRYYCTKCRQEFGSPQKLERHMKQHDGERPYACPDCDASFKHELHLRTHHRVHEGATPFKCPECSEVFKRSKDLKVHKRTHPGPNPFRCPDCPALFRYRLDLIKHYDQHPRETLHKCPSCPAAFLQLHQLEAHSSVHMENSL